MRAWQVCPKWKIALGAAAKCGSTTIAKLVQDNEARPLETPDARHSRVGRSDVPQGFQTIAVVRHPIDRFASLYANIQQRPRSRDNFYAQFEGLSPAACFDRILQVGLDREFHFQPQALCLGGPLDTVVRLENFAQWWSSAYPDTVPPSQLNMTRDRVTLDEVTQIMVTAHYALDLQLWEGAYGGR